MQTRPTFKDAIVGFAGQGGLHQIASQIFIVTMVLMVAALILMSFALSSLKASRLQSEAAEDTLLEITTVDSRLIDSDFALNGYVISADPWFAARIASVRADTETAMTKLGHSVRGDNELAAQYQVIAERLAQRRKVYDDLARPEHKNEVANVARSTAAQSERSLTDELRGRLWNLLHDERVKRFAQHTDMIGEAQNSFWIAAGIVILSILSGAINLVLMHFAAKGAPKPH